VVQLAGWSKPALVLLALWGIGNTMIIFLASLLDVPKHLYESAELDGAGAINRFRWVTLPSISPVILFSVVIGVIEALQYFTQAYVAATIARGGQAGDSLSDSATRAVHAVLPGPALPAGLPLLQHGLRRRTRGAALIVSLAVTFVILRRAERLIHYQGLVR
jgi:multiple sugar transport system permease protein